MNGPLLRHNVRVAGRGATTIVLGHGFGTDQTAWRHVSPWLAERYRVVLYDLAGSGPTGPEVFDRRRHASLDGHAEDLLAILSALGIRRCIHVGHSVSGMIGLLAAQQAPDRFERLIMLAPSPCYRNETDYRGGFEAAQLEALVDAISADYRRWIESVTPVAVQRGPEHPAFQEFSAGLLRLRPDIALCTAMMIFQSDLRDRLEDCPVPVLILQVRDDSVVPMSVGEYLRDHLPDARLEIVEAAGHLPHLTSPDKVIEILRRHL